MKAILLLMVLPILALPSALALNCTLFAGDYRTLCHVINPLPLKEDYKKDLMSPDLYGTVQSHNNGNINLNLQDQGAKDITITDIYEEKIVFIGRFALFIFFNYALFSILTKSNFIRKWLTAVY